MEILYKLSTSEMSLILLDKESILIKLSLFIVLIRGSENEYIIYEPKQEETINSATAAINGVSKHSI